MKPCLDGGNCSDNDEPPPLEDLTDQIEAALSLKSSLAQNSTPNEIKTDHSEADVKKTDNQTVEKSVKRKPENASFGGLNRGFLSGSKPSKKNTVPKTEEKQLTYIRAQPENSSLKFKEVEDAQKKPNWITDSLLDSVSGDNDLMRKLSDPKFSAVLEAFQKNPQAAMEKYGKDPEVAAFFKSFMGIFGDHFSKFTDETKSDASTSDIGGFKAPTDSDETKMQEILSIPEVREALTDDAIKTLFSKLRERPEDAQRMLHEKSTDMKFQKHVRVLCENGLLKFER